MNITDELTFEQWFDIFSEKCRKLGYYGPIDKYSFEDEYIDGKTPEYTAEEWIKEMD